MVSQSIKGELYLDSYKLTLQVFCDTLDRPKLAE